MKEKQAEISFASSQKLEVMMSENRIEEIKKRMEWMRENLSGCDWCCGGGEKEMEELEEELKELQGSVP